MAERSPVHQKTGPVVPTGRRNAILAAPSRSYTVTKDCINVLPGVSAAVLASFGTLASTGASASTGACPDAGAASISTAVAPATGSGSSSATGCGGASTAISNVACASDSIGGLG